jgi:flagellar protein FliS
MQPYQKYQKVNVSTADPLRIVILLYEGAIKNLHQAIRLLEENAAYEASAKINRTQDIVNYLRGCLDHEKGGEIAFNLDRLYVYMRDALIQANIHRDQARLREVIKLLQTLLEGWRGISDKPMDDSGAPTPDAATHSGPSADEPPTRMSLVG